MEQLKDADDAVLWSLKVPKLESVARKDIEEFMEERRRYVEGIAERNAREGTNLTAVSLRNSIAPRLLRTLAMMVFEKPLADVTDDDLSNFYLRTAQLDRNRIVRDIKELCRKHVQMNMSLDSTARIVDLSEKFLKMMEDEGIEELVETKAKMCCEALCQVLKPFTVKKHMESKKYLKPECFKSVPAFIKEAIEVSKVNDSYLSREFFPDLYKVKPEKPKPIKTEQGQYEQLNRRWGAAAGTGSGKKTEVPVKTERPENKQPAAVADRTRSKKKTGAICWHCGEGHMMDNCPLNPTEQEKSRARTRNRKLFKRIKSMTVEEIEQEAVSSSDQEQSDDVNLSEALDKFELDDSDKSTEHQEVSEFMESLQGSELATEADVPLKKLKRMSTEANSSTVIVQGVVAWKYCLDSGSEPVAVPHTIILAFERAGVKPEVKKLKQPLRVQLATEGATGTVSSYVYLDLTLHTMGGPLTLRRQRCLILDEDMDEILIGDELLKSLGINVDSQLAKLAEEWRKSDAQRVQLKDHPEFTKLQLKRVLFGTPSDLPEPPVVKFVQTTPIDAGDGELEDEQTPKFGDVQSDVSLEEALAALVAQAEANGLSRDNVKILKALLNEYEDIWRVQLVDMEEPAKVPPMKVKMKPDAKPYRCKARRYSPLHQAYMKQITTAMLKGNFIRKAKGGTTWAVNALVVDKNGIPQRVCGDYKPVNAMTEKTVFPMPHLGVILDHLKDARFFFIIDLFKGYWQFPLDVLSQLYFAFMTHDSIYIPLRVPMGATGAVDYFQYTVTNLFADLMFKNLLVWLDDLFGYASTQEGLLKALEKLFSICRKAKVKLNAKKCQLFNTQMKWCGKIYSADGVKHDPERIRAIQTMGIPHTAGQLQQAVCAMNWMRGHIPQYNQSVAPLLELLEQIYKKLGSRKKRTIANKPLASYGWSPHHDSAWRTCMDSLAKATCLAYPDDKKSICVFTDASDRFWAVVITQVPQPMLSSPIEDQDHEPLLFLSGEFKKSQLHWAIIEKEAFPIIQAVIKADYLLRRSAGFHLFTDHRNLSFLFNPKVFNPLCAKHTASRLERWAIRLMGLQYTIEFIPGKRNLFADLLTRWEVPALAVKRTIYIQEEVNPMGAQDFKWPDMQDIARVQAASDESLEAYKKHEKWGVLVDKNDCIWIPDQAQELKMRLLIVAHMRLAGHRGEKATRTVLKEHFTWKGLKQDVSTFIKQCIHCLSGKGGKRIPRPWGNTMHATKPNEVLWFDFVYISHAATKETYILVLRCVFSHYVELVPCKSADAVTTAKALCDWFKRFGMVYFWGSDRGSHFHNELIAEIALCMGVSHHFVTPYCPWANALSERPNRAILNGLRTLCSEVRLDFKNWPMLCPAIQYAMNNAPRERMNGLAAITVMTRLPAANPLSFCLPLEIHTGVSAEKLSELTMQYCISVGGSLDDFHQSVLESIEKRRQLSLKGSAPRRAKANFQQGDFVLVAEPRSMGSNKLTATFRGPYRVLTVKSEWICQVQHLITNKVRLAHTTRLKFYADNSLNVTTDLLQHIQHQDVVYEVDSIVDHRQTMTPSGPQVEFKIHWKAFDSLEDSWEPAETLQEDIPLLIRQYAELHDNDALLASFRGTGSVASG